MPLKDGDVIAFDYELWVEGRDGLFDTTLKEAAEAAGMLDPQAFYAPMWYVLGSGRIIPGLEEALRNSSIGKPETVEIPPERAYGARKPDLVETVPMNEFKKNDVTPQVGLALTYKNRRGVVTTVGGGRVRIDFNPTLAGKTLKYRFTLRRVAQDDAERVEGLLRMNFPANLAWKVEIGTMESQSTATVTVPEAAIYHQNWIVAKLRALMDARRYTKLERVRFIETYPLMPEVGQPVPAKI